MTGRGPVSAIAAETVPIVINRPPDVRKETVKVPLTVLTAFTLVRNGYEEDADTSCGGYSPMKN
jgi:hypothetical protein